MAAKGRKEPRRSGEKAAPGQGPSRAGPIEVPQDLHPPPPDSPRGRILAAARAAFAAEGFDGTSTRAIAATAGVNQAMIHYYFGSKARLYRRILAGELLAVFGSVSGPVLEPYVPAVEALLALPHALVANFRADPVRLALMRRELGTGATALRQVVVELGPAGPRGYRDLLRGRIEQARAGGGLRERDPDAVLTFLLTHAYGLILMEPVLRLVLGLSERDERAWDELLRAEQSLLRRALTGAETGEAT